MAGAALVRSSPTRVVEVAILTALAALLRGVLLLSTIDVPGDGPVKAWMAYSWAKAPHLVLHGIWPPGLTYLMGPITYVVPTWIALRLVNALAGTATVPVLFNVVARLFGWKTGLVAAAFIAVFPLHVELSATSLTEPTVILEILLAMAFLTSAVDSGVRGPTVRTGLAIASLVLASMTRYEVWGLLPLFPSYYWLRTRNGAGAATIAALLAAFPAAWCVGNYVYEGHALLGIVTATHDRGLGDSYQGVPLAVAGKLLVTRFAAGLGWVLAALLGLGIAMEGWSLMTRRLSLERTLYFAVVLIFLGGAAALTILRGETLPNRNLLFAFVFSVPIAIMPIFALARLRDAGRGMVGAMLAVTIVYTLGSAVLTGRLETVLLTRVKPQGMLRFEEWVRGSPWRDQSVVFTRMDWQPTYLPYYFPAFAWRTMIISEWVDDGTLRSMTEMVRPALLVTQPGDEPYVRRFVEVTGIAVDPTRVVHRNGGIEVYELSAPAPESGHPTSVPGARRCTP